ncbi:unnamed protein product [Ceratitis capitata]|uniref:(Mediterranean fruit fly) hypothetical protein n=1 Tax=Ceratitis capitata TaxID=7213 RepID=A0A811U0L3_CERCA|nr:unnamed protein product [Ceratitis capitata]
MLVATPGQTTTYSLLGSSAPKKTRLSSPVTSKNSNVNNPSVVNNNCSTSNAASTLMKTIQVRLNRGTEFLKDTVQKALTTTTNSNNTTSSASSITFRNNKTNNINATVVGTLKHAHVASAVAVRVPSRNTIASKSANYTTLATGASTSGGAIERTSISTNVSKTLKLNTVPPTKIHRNSQERQETSSTDSINKEMCHFKPILPAPTVRWKCGSKSRGGAAIRKPLACLATNIKNLNCDDCSKLTDDSSEEEEEAAEDDKESPTHLHKKHHFKPKPSSTLLTTIITSASHQSAFVRLVAQMKTLVDINQTTRVKSQNRFSKKKSQCKTHHTNTRLGRPSKAASGLKMQQLPKSPIKVPLTQLILRSRKQSFTQVNNLNLPTNLIIKKIETKTTEAASRDKSKPTITPRNKKGTTIPLQIATKKGTRNTTKSKVINIVAFAQEKIPNIKSNRTITKCNSKIETATLANVKHKQRKRKHIDESLSVNEIIDSAIAENASIDVGEESSLPPVRKSARLSKNGNDDCLKIDAVKRITIRRRNARSTQNHSYDTFSPPMTRSRVKELMQKQGNSSDYQLLAL